MSNDLSCMRRPSWSPTCSIFAVGSPSNNGMYLLDFYPDSSSSCHVDYNEDTESLYNANNNKAGQNNYVNLSESVNACASHLLNGSIITKNSSLLMISQRHESYRGEDPSQDEEEDDQ